MFNQTWNLQKEFFVFSEVAENILVNSEVTKSDDNLHLHEIYTKLLQMYWLRKAVDTNDEISTPSHLTHVQNFRPGENSLKQWVRLVENCESFIWDSIETSWLCSMVILLRHGK